MISEKLSVDLSQITADLAQLRAQSQSQDARTGQVMRRVQETNRTVSALERTSEQMFSKIKAQARSLFKGGISSGITSVLDSINLDDDPLAMYGRNILSSTVTGLAFGGPSGAVIAGLTASVAGLKGLIEGVNRKLDAVQAEQRNRIAEFEGELARRAIEFRQEMEESNFRSREIDREAKEEAAERLYQTWQYVN